ncbi:MAG: hypothetical protein WDO70_02785 [Alphaproteobacteria bacterium]
MRKQWILAAALSAAAFQPAMAAEDVQHLGQELKDIKAVYQQKIDALETRLKQLEDAKAPPPAQAHAEQAAPSAAPAASNANAFNPAIGLVLNGQFGAYSKHDRSVSGFAIGDEGERAKEGMQLGESELSLSANADDMFTAQFTGSFATDNGEDGVEIEEAFVQSLGLPYGINIKAGRMLASLGYMNEKHAHTDDFVDRPLPYRAFLNNAFNDDGAQASVVLPTPFYSEIGGGVWRGDDFPGANAQGAGPGAYSAFARVGGDIGDDQNWRLGFSYLHSRTGGDGRITGGDGMEQIFKGEDSLYIADAKYNWAPTGNAAQQELSLQGEFFRRQERGSYADNALGIGDTDYRGGQNGWYGQAVYKFLPQWRVGYRYTGLSSGDVPDALAGGGLDAMGHDPYVHSAMADYTHSEFSRIRLQYNNDHTGPGTDNQFLAQYIMSLGAHGAHKY